MIPARSLVEAIGKLADQPAVATEVLKSPGQLARHYAPKARLIIRSWSNDSDLKAQLEELKFLPAQAHVIAHSQIPTHSGLGRISVIPNDAAAYARALYAELHRSDESGAGIILVEAPPSSPEWLGIADRLHRAASEERRG